MDERLAKMLLQHFYWVLEEKLYNSLTPPLEEPLYMSPLMKGEPLLIESLRTLRTLPYEFSNE